MSIDGTPVTPQTSVLLTEGQSLEIGHPRTGTFAYLAASGGFAVEPELGSLSFHLRSRLGGLKGAAMDTTGTQWRGALGWVCVAGYFWHFVASPVVGAVAVALGHPLDLPTLDVGPLATLTVGMLGLGGLHVAERVKGVA